MPTRRKGGKLPPLPSDPHAELVDDGPWPGSDPSQPAPGGEVDLSKFPPEAREIIRLKLKFPRATQADISRLMGLSRGQVNKHFKVEDLNRICAWIERDLHTRMGLLRERIMGRLEEMVARPGTEDWVLLSIARDVLGPVFQSKAFLPQPLEVKDVEFVDENRPQLPPDKV